MARRKDVYFNARILAAEYLRDFLSQEVAREEQRATVVPLAAAGSSRIGTENGSSAAVVSGSSSSSSSNTVAEVAQPVAAGSSGNHSTPSPVLPDGHHQDSAAAVAAGSPAKLAAQGIKARSRRSKTKSVRGDKSSFVKATAGIVLTEVDPLESSSPKIGAHRPAAAAIALPTASPDAVQTATAHAAGADVVEDSTAVCNRAMETQVGEKDGGELGIEGNSLPVQADPQSAGAADLLLALPAVAADELKESPLSTVGSAATRSMISAATQTVAQLPQVSLAIIPTVPTTQCLYVGSSAALCQAALW